jgi:hypothetical protein
MVCGGRGSVGRATGSQGRSILWAIDRRARTNGASTPPPNLRRAAHGRSKALAEDAADGKVVWSCNPVLFSFAKERIKRREAKGFGDIR